MTMVLADWSSKIEFGLPGIDAQHRQLFDLAATFADNGDQIRVMKSIVSLCEYVKVHFREEEELMEACGFPGLEVHRGEHEKFRQLLLALLENAKKMTLDQIAEEVKYLINGWFYNHILTADFQYLPYARTLGGCQETELSANGTMAA